MADLETQKRAEDLLIRLQEIRDLAAEVRSDGTLLSREVEEQLGVVEQLIRQAIEQQTAY